MEEKKKLKERKKKMTIKKLITYQRNTVSTSYYTKTWLTPSGPGSAAGSEEALAGSSSSFSGDALSGLCFLENDIDRNARGMEKSD